MYSENRMFSYINNILFNILSFSRASYYASVLCNTHIFNIELNLATLSDFLNRFKLLWSLLLLLSLSSLKKETYWMYALFVHALEKLYCKRNDNDTIQVSNCFSFAEIRWNHLNKEYSSGHYIYYIIYRVKTVINRAFSEYTKTCEA